MNSTKILDVWDPDFDPIEKEQRVDIFGFVNAEVEFKSIPHKKVTLLRVPLRLGVNGNYHQVLLEIWCGNKKEEPIFTQDWTRCQLAYIRDVKFVEYRECYGLKFYQFVLNSYSSSRFIWLTDDSKNFWSFPIPEPEDIRLYAFHAIQTGDSTLSRGFVGRSNGSIFARCYSAESCNIHTSTKIGETTFINWYNEMLSIKSFLLDSGNELIKKNKSKVADNLLDGPLQMHL